MGALDVLVFADQRVGQAPQRALVHDGIADIGQGRLDEPVALHLGIAHLLVDLRTVVGHDGIGAGAGRAGLHPPVAIAQGLLMLVAVVETGGAQMEPRYRGGVELCQQGCPDLLHLFTESVAQSRIVRVIAHLAIQVVRALEIADAQVVLEILAGHLTEMDARLVVET